MGKQNGERNRIQGISNFLRKRGNREIIRPKALYKPMQKTFARIRDDIMENFAVDNDGNNHVNNTTCLEMLQTALYHQKLDTHPSQLQIQFSKEIPPDTEYVNAGIENKENEKVFSIGPGEEIAATGRVS
ncbi:MAG: hypothetical protein CMI18_04080 [Opitutaceae bacterium]|nr:hypothetical protein [Opitutaceae bacterium]